jgi:Ras-related protein Rab-7A
MLRGIQAPSAGDEEADNFRCVVVGNKMDLLQPGMDATAHKFVQGLVPVSQPELSGRVEEEIVAEDIISGGNDFRARIHL